MAWDFRGMCPSPASPGTLFKIITYPISAMTATAAQIDKKQIYQWLREVRDPEIPVLNVVEMGIVCKVQVYNKQTTVHITPTYSGCPAMSAIENNIRSHLKKKGLQEVKVKKDFSASWTTDWMTREARQKLKEFGIAPPEHRAQKNAHRPLAEKSIACPYCDSTRTSLQSEFGSTACKAQFYCKECEQAFEHFKCH